MSPDHGAWFRKADEDLAMLDIGIAGNAPWPQICVHAQQLAEKYLKGYLVYHGVLPPKIHDLERLLELCAMHDATLKSLSDDALRLTDFGARSRYPGEIDEPAEAEGRAAVEDARRIRAAVRQRVLGPDPANDQTDNPTR